MLLVAAAVWLGWLTARMIFPENFIFTTRRSGTHRISSTKFFLLDPERHALAALFWSSVHPVAEMAANRRARCPFRNRRWAWCWRATYLTKISNAPLLAVSAAIVLVHIWQLKKSNKLRAAFPSLVALALCASLPIVAWLAWCKYNFGDFTGTAAKVHFSAGRTNPSPNGWSHPIFTPRGLWTFVSDLLATFLARRNDVASAAADPCRWLTFFMRFHPFFWSR